MLDNNDKNLVEAEIWQKSLIDAALDAVMIIDDEGLILDFNPSAEDIFGFKKEAVVGKLMADLIVPPKLRKAHSDGLARLKATNVPKILGQRLELPAIRSDGSEFPAELIVVQVPIKPRPVYVGYIRDISDRKQAEAALRASVQHFRSLADSSPLMIWLADTDGSVGWFNKSWLEFTGSELENVIGDGWMELIHHEDIPAYMEAYQNALRSGDAYSIEFRLLHVDGTHHWMLANVATTLHPDGSIAGYAGSCVDITRRREMESSLRLTQFTMDGAADQIYWLRSDGTLHYVNDNACRALGYSQDELLSLTLTDVILNVRLTEWDTRWQEIKEARQLTFETEFLRKDGSDFPVEITVNHIQFQNQEFVCAFARDITERRDSQVALADAMLEAQAANQAKSEFLAVVSHEMRTPLNSILGSIELSLQDGLNGEQRELMSMCQRSGIQLKELINDMLDYSQIQAGRFSLQSNVMDVGRLLERTHSLFIHRTQEKDLEFRWQVAKDVPTTLVGDSRRLSQVVENLLNNAVKFTDSGYVAFRVELISETEQNVTLRFSVEDSGIGVDPENRARIFGRFEQVDSGPTRAFGGVGLGLSICAQLVELMCGQIDFAENKGGGSQFFFTACFDRVTEEHTRENSKSEMKAIHSEDLQFTGIRVLLAEDDPPSSLVAKRMLERAGVQVTAVTDGLAAIETFREDPQAFDAIFMDVMMPRLDGIEATRQIRELQKRRIPVIAMTAQAMLGDRERILRSEVDAYIAKPIDRQLVLGTLKKMLGGSTAAEDKREDPSARSQIFDREALIQRCGGDMQLIAEVVGLFASTCDETIERLEKALASGDQSAAVQAAHRLKGAVGNMCAQQAYDLCIQIELEAQKSELLSVHSRMSDLRLKIQRLRTALEILVS